MIRKTLAAAVAAALTAASGAVASNPAAPLSVATSRRANAASINDHDLIGGGFVLAGVAALVALVGVISIVSADDPAAPKWANERPLTSINFPKRSVRFPQIPNQCGEALARPSTGLGARPRQRHSFAPSFTSARVQRLAGRSTFRQIGARLLAPSPAGEDMVGADPLRPFDGRDLAAMAGTTSTRSTPPATSFGEALAGINHRSRASWLGAPGGAGVGKTASVSRTGRIHIPVPLVSIRPWGSIPSLT